MATLTGGFSPVGGTDRSSEGSLLSFCGRLVAVKILLLRQENLLNTLLKQCTSSGMAGRRETQSKVRSVTIGCAG
jgi:hypothetical protein